MTVIAIIIVLAFIISAAYGIWEDRKEQRRHDDLMRKTEL